MIFQTYFDLIDENRLPPGARFVDPYDLTVFDTKTNQTLTEFITLYEAARTEKHQPQITQTELKRLVVDSLYESSSPKNRANYFQQLKTPPNFVQAYHFIRTTAQTLIQGNHTPQVQRENRAQHCLNNCKFHSRSSNWSKPVKKAISNLVGIQENTVSTAEKMLGSCMGCGGCALQPKVGYTTQSVIANLTPDQIDMMIRVYGNQIFTQCWMFEESLQDPTVYQLLRNKILHTPQPNSARTTSALQYMTAAKKA